MHGVQVVVDPFSAPYLQGAEVDYVDTHPGVRLRDQQPERRLLLRLRPLLPGRRRRRSAEGAVGGCGSGCSRLTSSIAFMSGPLRVAVVGSGPAGFYAAGALLDADAAGRGRHDRAAADAVGPRAPRRRARPSEAEDRLARVRADRRRSRASASSATSRSDAISRTPTCVRLYDAVVYAVGAQTDRRLGIPGEDLPGSWSATEFVAWYNGHPDYQELQFDLDVERAVVIGNGNVALDVARMLALTPEELAPTDTTDAAIEAIGRRRSGRSSCWAAAGPAQAACTTQELKELGELAGADVIVDPAELELDPASEARSTRAIAAQPRGAARLRRARAGGQAATRRLRFLASPVAIHGDGRVESIELVRNRLEERGRPPRSPSRRTSTRRSSAGSSSAASAIAASALPGRPVRRAARDDPQRGRPRPRRRRQPRRSSYCAGWIKRGPTGSSARTRRTRPRPSRCCSRTSTRGRIAHRRKCTPAAAEALLAERDVRAVSTRAGRRSTSSSEPRARSSAARG